MIGAGWLDLTDEEHQLMCVLEKELAEDGRPMALAGALPLLRGVLERGETPRSRVPDGAFRIDADELGLLRELTEALERGDLDRAEAIGPELLRDLAHRHRVVKRAPRAGPAEDR